MNTRALALFFWGCLVAGAAVAGEGYKSEIKIAVDTDGDEPQVFEWHSDDPDADLSALEVGESRTLQGDDGREVTVTRSADGFEFDVDGKKIEMFEFAGDGDVTVDVEVLHDGDGKMHEIHKSDGHHSIVVDKTRKVKVIKTDDTDGVTIISSDAIDAETRAKIEAILKEAGKDGEVMFLDGSELSGEELVHGEHRKVIIRKEVEKSND